MSSGNKPSPWPMFSKICISLSRSQRVNIFTDSRWTDWFLSRSLHGFQLNLQKTKIRVDVDHTSQYPTWQCRTAISSTLIRSLCRQGYSFALATPGAPVSPLCFADHAVKQSVMHAPGFAAASATPGSQWHKTMLGQSHHGTNSYKGRHKQRNRSKRFPIYCLRRPTRLHWNPAETSHTRIHRAGIRRLELGWYLSDFPGVEPTPGSTDCTQGVCGVVGLDCADGLEREIERHPATHTYFEYTSIKAYKPCAQKNYHVSSDTALRARLDCTETGDVIHKNSPGWNSTDRTRRILFRLSRMDPLPGSIDCRQGVCGVVRFDCADGLELVIQRYAPTQPYFENTFIKSWESCEQKNYR